LAELNIIIATGYNSTEVKNMEHKKDMQAARYCPFAGKMIRLEKQAPAGIRRKSLPCMGKNGKCDNIYTGCGIV